MIKKLFIIVNVDWFFLSHRLPVALAAQRAGWDVTIVMNAISGLGGFFAEDNKSLMALLMPNVLKFSHNRKKLIIHRASFTNKS